MPGASSKQLFSTEYPFNHFFLQVPGRPSSTHSWPGLTGTQADETLQGQAPDSGQGEDLGRGDDLLSGTEVSLPEEGRGGEGLGPGGAIESSRYLLSA